MKKILVILMFIIILTSCENKEEVFEGDQFSSYLKTVEITEIDILDNVNSEETLSDIKLPTYMETEKGTVTIVWSSSNNDSLNKEGDFYKY